MNKAEILLNLLESDATTRDNLGEPTSGGKKLQYVDLIYCPKCNTEIEVKDNTKKMICPNCGEPLVITDASEFESKEEKKENKVNETKNISITSAVDKIEGNTNTMTNEKEILVDYLLSKFNTDFNVEMNSSINEGLQDISLNISPNLPEIDIIDDISEIYDINKKDIKITESNITFTKLVE